MAKPIFDDNKEVGETNLFTNVAAQELNATSQDGGDLSVDIKIAQAPLVKTTEKRVSRYSERRNKIKERFSQRENATVSNDAIERPSAIDSAERVSSGVEKIHIDSVQSKDVTTSTNDAANIESHASEILSKSDISVVIENE